MVYLISTTYFIFSCFRILATEKGRRDILKNVLEHQQTKPAELLILDVSSYRLHPGLSNRLNLWINHYIIPCILTIVFLGHIKFCSHPKLNISSLLHLTWIKLSLKNAHWKCWVWNWTPGTYLSCWGSKVRHCEDLYLIWNNEKT